MKQGKTIQLVAGYATIEKLESQANCIGRDVFGPDGFIGTEDSVA